MLQKLKQRKEGVRSKAVALTLLDCHMVKQLKQYQPDEKDVRNEVIKDLSRTPDTRLTEQLKQRKIKLLQEKTKKIYRLLKILEELFPRDKGYERGNYSPADHSLALR